MNAEDPPKSDPVELLPHPRRLTVRDLLDSELVGMWADRTDIIDSSKFALELRHKAARVSYGA